MPGSCLLDEADCHRLDGDEIFAMGKLIYVEFWCGVVVKMRAV